jgi:Uma2 family endonuclease
MVTTPLRPNASTIASPPEVEDYNANILPPDCFDAVPEGMEEVDGQPTEKTYMTLKHAGLQNTLGAEWRAYSRTSQQGGRTYVEALCRTQSQKRRPDVAYLTAAMLQVHGEPSTFPQSFSLIGEIASPDDPAEMLFEKAQEYLDSGAEEVWILLPETQVAFIVLADQILAFKGNQTIATQKVLTGFSIALPDLFS